MKARRVFVVGESLFAETLVKMLAGAESIEVIGSAPTLKAALPLIETGQPHAVIVASAGEIPAATGEFLSVHLDLPIICADLSMNHVRVITSQRIAARSDNLIKAIRRLPARRPKRKLSSQT